MNNPVLGVGKARYSTRITSNDCRCYTGGSQTEGKFGEDDSDYVGFNVSGPQALPSLDESYRPSQKKKMHLTHIPWAPVSFKLSEPMVRTSSAGEVLHPLSPLPLPESWLTESVGDRAGPQIRPVQADLASTCLSSGFCFPPAQAGQWFVTSLAVVLLLASSLPV